MSYVRRPSGRASVPSYAPATCAPATSSTRGACQPPNGNPTGSSSAAGRLPDEVEGCEQLDVDEAHALLPMSWLPRSGGRPVGAGRLIAATAPSFVLVDRLARCIGHHPVSRSASLRRPAAGSAGMPCALIQARTSDSSNRYDDATVVRSPSRDTRLGRLI